jgi:hypothetical protein
VLELGVAFVDGIKWKFFGGAWLNLVFFYGSGARRFHLVGTRQSASYGGI